MHPTTRLTACLALLLAGTLSGCGLFKEEDEDSGYAGPPDDAILAVKDAAPAPDNTPIMTSPETGFAVDGMVGQVNGEPIFADFVFSGTAEPIHHELAGLGRREARPTFRVLARDVIVRKLREIVLNALVLAEAERDLSDSERQRLKLFMDLRREELVRKYGRGSTALAEAQILEQTGKSLKDTMAEIRQRTVVERYLGQTITPLIHVGRDDVERVYAENREKYQPPPTRLLRFIMTATDQDASAVRARLDAGEPFAQIADSDLNAAVFGKGSGGDFFGDLPGDRPLAPYFDPINDAIQNMTEGEYAGPIPLTPAGKPALHGQWFVFVDTFIQPEVRTLMDVQLQIEGELRAKQYRTETQRYYARLMETGSYNPIGEMADLLVEIAVTRYAVFEAGEIDSVGG